MTCLWFDGAQLNVIENGVIVKSWLAFSGNAGTTKKQDEQKKKDIGPVPEGCYAVDPAKITYQKNLSWWRRWFKYTQTSWGKCWVPLEVCQAETHGRSGFYIHGGIWPGSKGCIDLLNQDEDFCFWLKNHGKKVCVIVKYLPETQSKPGVHDTPNNCPENPGLYCLQNSNCSKRYNEENLRRERAQELPNATADCERCECCRER